MRSVLGDQRAEMAKSKEDERTKKEEEKEVEEEKSAGCSQCKERQTKKMMFG